MGQYCLAIDIGASSGRHIVGWLENDAIRTEEVYRFPNGITRRDGHATWDIDSLFAHVKAGIRAALVKYPRIRSLAVDTWGVDYVLIENDKIVTPAYAYRDDRTAAVIDEVHKATPFETLYRRTGIQFQPFNTVYQLYDDLRRGRLERATDFLMIPAYLNYMLTGVKMHEYTDATTTGLVNVETKEYDDMLTEKLGLPKRLFGKLHTAGTFVGELKPDVAAEVGGQIDVVLCASHDTASAVEGIPMTENSPYISSGTWSLLGLKIEKAATDENSRMANFSNEGGVGYIRYQKNIMGMWIVNRLKDDLCPGKSFAQIVEEARKSRYDGVVDVDDRAFLAPSSMKAAFDGALAARKPQSESDYFRCAFLSLATGYKTALEALQKVGGQSFDTLYIVGGGAKNGLLNQMTEDICNVNVRALPIEATALGNLKIQLRR